MILTAIILWELFGDYELEQEEPESGKPPGKKRLLRWDDPFFGFEGLSRMTSFQRYVDLVCSCAPCKTLCIKRNDAILPLRTNVQRIRFLAWAPHSGINKVWGL